ncbi:MULTISPECIES: AraC family transcriptional regulator [unclassified Moorena]|uniref:helix-turn-helix domain-containing protein n=1 Tax=unclassified Moorena TaxID=2683338 RepID=UPI0013B64B49|nr:MULTISPECIES: AraC family transcriptional regulator [unclassified Moorena]NEP34189.1 helix-turn-helix transcriptional regulator [Moorena sp. SIO3B2]NEQ09807.1 helix-turn-helix transcriptional regulator [Moorena sp. SIO4E2]
MTLLIDANNSKTTQPEDDPGTGNQNIVSKSITDVDSVKEFFKYKNREIIQLSPGPLQAKFLSIQVGNLFFVYNQVNQGIQLSGEGQNEYICFGIIYSENEKEYYSFRHPVEPQRTIFGFNGKGADAIFPQGITLTQIIIPVPTFDAYADQLQRQDLDDKFRSKNHVNLLPTGMNEIKDYVKELIWLAVHKPNWLQQPHIEELVRDDFLPLLISNIPTKLNSKCFLKASRRAKLIAQAEKKMLAHLEKPLTLKQLAQNLGSSSSALSYGFQDLFGLSPMRYLKVRRLNAVRERLKASEPERCTIAILASEFGFYSPCHFTRDYKAMFGELPSETLRNTGN